MVIDSGTTFTMLPADTYRRLSTEFNRQMTLIGFVRTAAAEQRTGLGPCYGYMPLMSKTSRVPTLGLHYAGNTTVWLPTRNFFLEFKNERVRVGCLAVMSTGDEAAAEDGGGPAGTLGNFQQQGMEVVYDLQMGRVGFARRRCGDLWDSPSRG
ncbi:hypothetical protein HPP92_014046 [Vanilla planifolia]|uniref:Peptidase A1 domain-containing protein n=1 Tax=Vanilla planifolia TaxID=51239 RepID=A0A835QQ65_VANPL|nr:hypothetical protein HPP92_014046 [Vanilla planifolia]